MNLFPPKAIAWPISEKPDIGPVMNVFKKLRINRTALPSLCPILIKNLNILRLHLGSYWIFYISYSHSQRRDILSIILAANVSSNMSKKKKLIGKTTTLCKNYKSPCLNILKMLQLKKTT